MALPQSMYATIAQLQTLSITQAQTTRFGVPAMTASLQAASSIADSYIASQFVLPLKANPIGGDMSLVMAVCAIAAYILNNQAGYNPGAPIDESIKARYDESLKWLELVRDKKIFPQWADSSGDPIGIDEGGDFVISDLPVGFTSRGASRRGVLNADSNWPWFWEP